MKDIRGLAERVIEAEDDYERGSIHPMAAPPDREVTLARFALAVLDALAWSEALEESVGSSDRLECLREVRAAIDRRMKEARK